MAFLIKLLLAAAVGWSAVSATPLAARVFHDDPRVPSGYKVLRRAAPHTILPFRIGLRQSNIEDIEEYLLDVSHPESPNYGKHWSAAQVAETFRPSQESVESVHSWLVESGIDVSRIRLSASGAWVQANVTIVEAERLLETEYYIYEHEETAGKHIACGQGYTLPAAVAPHVDIVLPTIHFDAKRRGRRSMKRSGSGPGNAAGSSGRPVADANANTSELANCDKNITLACLRVLYNFPEFPTHAVSSNRTIGIVEYTPQAYTPEDLDMFFKTYSPSQVGERPNEVDIDGGTIHVNSTSTGLFGESNLDLQYAMGILGRSQDVILYQNGDLVEGSSFDNFLDALDGSFCTFEGGDDPSQDSIYPDPAPGGFKGPENCGQAPLAHVISTSYGTNEASLTPAYAQRQCAEYAKLGLMGTTVLYSSGDEGVSGHGELCIAPNGTEVAGTGAFNPTFPGVCPFVTSVGATQVNPGASVHDPESSCQQVIFPGGGFSNVFALPSYQKTAVETYLTKFPPPYSPTQFNSTGKSRGFPDISANGANYIVAVLGEFEHVFGTSCATPVSAAFFAAINDARAAQNKSSLGFINPTIYSSKFKDAFNDITNGTNPGCGTEGFAAQPGWDPLTGLGTPNVEKLLQLFLELP
ncbi:subtilisin-like protein [Obba rivulosa]|uniref:tripeptidyl-peptidase II n=1 Tax=Obba rivulosa TaxID=1052685 RepID=A0A8E2DJC7_9APHY|nr:subtilisin-like protein [Obba rivulosa]